MLVKIIKWITGTLLVLSLLWLLDGLVSPPLFGTRIITIGTNISLYLEPRIIVLIIFILSGIFFLLFKLLEKNIWKYNDKKIRIKIIKLLLTEDAVDDIYLALNNYGLIFYVAEGLGSNLKQYLKNQYKNTFRTGEIKQIPKKIENIQDNYHSVKSNNNNGDYIFQFIIECINEAVHEYALELGPKYFREWVCLYIQARTDHDIRLNETLSPIISAWGPKKEEKYSKFIERIYNNLSIILSDINSDLSLEDQENIKVLFIHINVFNMSSKNKILEMPDL